MVTPADNKFRSHCPGVLHSTPFLSSTSVLGVRLVTVRAHFSEGLRCVCYVPHRSFYVLFHSILKAVLWDQQYLCFLSVDQWFSTRDDSVPGNICQCLMIALVFRAVEARGALNVLRCAGWPPTNRECPAQNVNGDAVRKPCCRWQSWGWKWVATWPGSQWHFRGLEYKSASLLRDTAHR